MPADMPKMASLRRVLRLTCLLALLAQAAARAQVAATSLSLAADATTPAVHQLVHFSATLTGGSSTGASTPTGTVIFLDGASTVATVPLNPHGATILGVASLAQGNHSLTAVYSGDNANSASSAAAVNITVTGLPAPFTVLATPGSPFANASTTLAALGLPGNATGSVSFSDGSDSLGTIAITGASVASYQAFGDSITSGFALAAPAQRYANLLAVNYGLLLNDPAIVNAIACDVLPTQILANNIGPSQASSPLSSLMIGSVDTTLFLASTYAPVFHACHQAALAWLAIPREYKLLANDSGVSILSGPWAVDAANFNSLTATSGTLRFNIITAGEPIYLWQLLSDAVPGSFTLTLDGTPAATTYDTQSSPSIGSQNNTQLKTFGLIRLPAAAGAHTVDVTVASGTVGVLGAATAPSPGGASVHPTVLATDVPNEFADNASGAVAQYTQAIQADVALLAGDGLDVRFVPTQSLMSGNPSEMTDAINPNALGHAQIAAAFEHALGNLPTAPFTSFINTPPSAVAAFANPGSHIVTANYSGDETYAATTASTTITVQPQQATLTALATPATHAAFGASVVFTAAVSPASATGSITFYDGAQTLTTLPLISGATAFPTNTLAVGIHNLTAVYSGDTADIASASPPLAIEIQSASTTISLAALPLTAIYGSATALTATTVPASATGSITFTDSFLAPSQTVPQIIALGQATLTSGIAMLSPTLAAGSHSITASYSGDASDLPANSTAVPTTIGLIPTTTTLGEPPASSAFGNSLTFTANVSPATASGTVTFRDSVTGTLAQTAVINGTATTTTGALSVAAHTLTALYSGDATHAASASSSVSTQITTAATTTALAAVAANNTLGTPLTLNAQITPASATGTVIFRDATIGVLGEVAVVRGLASLQLTALPVGQYSITATYSGDAFNSASTSAAITTRVALASTTTTLSQPATALYSAPVTLTASVSAATATGLVQFSGASGLLATALLVNGTATVQLANLATGSHVIRASYLGDAGDAPSTSTAATTIVTADATATTLTLAQNSVPAAGNVIVDVRVSSALNSAPSGAVTLRSGTTVLATAALSNINATSAYATLTFTASALGTSSLVASYSGDTNNLASTSGAAAYTVVAAPTLATLALSAAQVPLQTSVMLTATIASVNAIPTGSVLFTSNGNTLATVSVNASGTATLTLPSTTAGAYTIGAIFIPTGLFAASTTTPQTLVVTLPVALTLLPSTLNAAPGSTYNANLTLTPLSGFSGSITTQCVSPATYITCTIDAPSRLAGTPVNATVHVAIASSTAASVSPLLALLLLPLLFRRKARQCLVLLLISAVAAATTACAGGGSFFDIPTGTQTMAINVTAAGVMVTTNLQLNVSQ